MKRVPPAKQWTRTQLFALGIPGVLIPGLLLAMSLGWNPEKLLQSHQYYQNTTVFPSSATVSSVIDGDTLRLSTGAEVRLLGIDAPGRGEEGAASASAALRSLVEGKTVYLEYDRYQDDKFGRLLAWVWVDCEQTPVFVSPDYMYKSQRESQPGLMDNPRGCVTGTLVNEAMLNRGHARIVTYRDRGELKYEKRLERVLSNGL